MFRKLLFAGLLTVASAAQAGDKPVVAPAPAWVKATPLPPLPAKRGEAPVQMLLSDQQIAFEGGKQTIYSDIALLIQTPQGLDAGNISLPWRPDTDELIVHRLAIHRGDKLIDVLAGGQTFSVMRRETNLESAILDGVLTANIQPEGLQVGDVLQLTISVVSTDPVMKGHAEAIAATWNGVPITRAHLRVQWPAATRVQLREAGPLPALKTVESNGVRSVEIALNDVTPAPGPAGAPLRYQLGRRVEVTDFASWAELGSLLAPLYATAAKLPATGSLADEVARIAAASPDPRQRAQAALALVQDRVRYVALAMGRGGLVPADAAATWSRRYGDCKAKTAILLAILSALGVQAEPVAVSAQLGDGLDERLPMVGAFNHVLVRATIGGRTFWLDGTRKGDTSLDRLTVPDFGWGLPLVPRNAQLVRIVPAALDQPTQDVSIRIDAREGLTLPAAAHVETVFRGDAALNLNAGLATVTGEARDRALKEYWKGEHDFIEPSAVGATFDPATGELRLTLDGKAKMDWSSGWYETDGTALGYRADFTRQPGQDRDAPYSVAHPRFTRTVETILLPAGFPDQPTKPGQQIDRTVAGVEYRRSWTLAKQVFRVERSERSVTAEFPAKDAPAAQEALREMAKQALYIRRPKTYSPTDGELAAMLLVTPTTADTFVERGNVLLDRGRFDEAYRDFDRAVALDPKHEWALADRGITLVWQDKFDEAAKDLDAVARINPRNVVLFRARGLMAQKKGDHRAAVEAYTVSLQLEPNNGFALTRRAASYRALGDDQAALADVNAGLALQPRSIELYGMRANIYRRLGQEDKMLADAAAVASVNSDESYAQVLSANLYASAGREAEAARAFDRALAIKPEAYIYFNRALGRPKADRAGRIADMDAALKLDPKSTDALAGKAELLADGGDHRAALALIDRAVALAPDDPDLLLRRGILKLKAKDQAGGDRDFAAARAQAKGATALNNMCWSKATAGVALDSALADCEQALAQQPGEAAYLDSKAFVLLRLGRNDEAIEAYDEALARTPTQAASLYGRAVAWARKGDRTMAAADVALALKQWPKVAKTFADYGVTIEAP